METITRAECSRHTRLKAGNKLQLCILNFPKPGDAHTPEEFWHIFHLNPLLARPSEPRAAKTQVWCLQDWKGTTSVGSNEQ